MPLRNPLPRRPKRSRLQTSIAGEIHEQVDLYCAHHGLTEAAFFEAAALEKIAGSGDAKQILRRFGEQRKLVLQLRQYVEISAELLSFYVQHALRNTPPLPKAELVETRRQGDAAYQALVRRIGQNLSSRRGFFEGFPSEQGNGDPTLGSPPSQGETGVSRSDSAVDAPSRPRSASPLP
ncbi:MAG TPA: hypothetical protein VI197_12000 [Polyangiaceae bacterium]